MENNRKYISDQQETINAIAEFLSGSSVEKNELQTAAVIGRRGMGKTTLLRGISEALALGSKYHFVSTPIIDAATVRDDFGLMAEVIESLQYTSRQAKQEHPTKRLGDARRDDPEKALFQTGEDCLQAILVQERSHRKLTRDLAMSPGHYGQLVQDAARKMRDLPQVLGAYARRLKEFHGILHDRRPEDVRCVVYVDDMDLGSPKLMQSFARLLLDECREVDLYWIFAFDRRRMVAVLAPEMRGEDKVDTVAGEALLQKLVPFHRSHHLQSWKRLDRTEFAPLGSQAAGGMLGQLLSGAKMAQMALVLPSHPRALEGIYRWLTANQKQNGSERQKIAAERVLRTIALASGQSELAALLEPWRGARISSMLDWDPEIDVTETVWDAMEASARANEPIWGLPVPQLLRTYIDGDDIEGYLEILIDILLKSGDLEPYQLLRRMHFARTELEKARLVAPYSEEELVSHFEPEETNRTLAVGWQIWSKSTAEWQVTIGPKAFWEVWYHSRSAVPSDLLQAILLPLSTFDDAIQFQSNTPDTSQGDASARAQHGAGSPLPMCVRGLVLLVAGLRRAPWREIDAIWKLWDPLTRTCVGAGLTLSAYAWALWGHKNPYPPTDEKTQPPPPPLLHVTLSRSAEQIAKLDAEGVLLAYQKLLEWLDGATKDEYVAQNNASVSGSLASEELRKALRVMLSLDPVRKIAS